MPNARRTAKKTAKRGRVATPDVMMPGQKEWIPGVPAFHEGTVAMHSNAVPGDAAHPGMTPDRYLQHLQAQEIPTEAPPPPGGRDYANATEQDLLLWATQGDPTAIAMLTFGQTTGGGGSTGLTQFEQELMTRRTELEELIAQNRVDAANLDREGDAAIASKNRESIERVELLKREAEAALLGYNQERDTLDRQIQQFQLNLTQRGQDITQRAQDIDSQLTQNSQLIEKYNADLRAAQLSGDQNAIRDAEDRLRSANQQQAALQQFDAQLGASGQELQAMTSGGQQLGTLAGLEQQRQQDLIGLSQDPRDFMGFLNATGGGTNFLDRLSRGQPVGGQSATTGLDPLGGAGNMLQTLIGQIGQTPAFDAAMSASQGLGQFQAPTPLSLEDILALGPGAISQSPQIPSSPQLNTGIPGAVSGLGPEAVLNPAEQAIFAQFRAAAPDVPIDIAISIARNPAAARQFLGAAGPGPAPIPPDVAAEDTGIGRDDPASFFPSNPAPGPRFDQAGWPIDNNGQRIAMPPGWLPEGSQYASLQQQVVPKFLTPEKFSSWVRNGADEQFFYGTLAAAGADLFNDIMPIAASFPRDASLKSTGAAGGGAAGGLAAEAAPAGASGADFLSREYFSSPEFRAKFGDTSAVVPYLWNSPYAQTPDQLSQGVPPFREVNPTGLPTVNPDFQGNFTPRPIEFDRYGLPLATSQFGAGYEPGAPRPPQNLAGQFPTDTFGTGPQYQFQTPRDTPEYQAWVTQYRDFLANQGTALGPRGDPRSGLLEPIQIQAPAQGAGSRVTAKTISSNLGKFEAFKAGGGVSAIDFQKTLNLAGGGGIVVDEPSVLLGLRTGRPLATMGEPTREYPNGIPELFVGNGRGGADVIPPMHSGGRIEFEDGRDELGRPIVQPVPPPVEIPVGVPEAPLGYTGIESQFVGQLPTAGIQPIGGGIQPIEKPPTAPSPYGFGVTPENPGGVPDPPPGSGDTGMLQQQVPLEPGQLLRNLFSLNPQSYYGLLPSQQDILFSIGRSLGFPEADARASIERKFPNAVDPSRLLTAGF